MGTTELSLKKKSSMFYLKCLVRGKQSLYVTVVCTSLFVYTWRMPVPHCVLEWVTFFFCIISFFLLSIKTWIFKTTSNKHSWNIKMLEKQEKLLSSFIFLFSFSPSLFCTHTQNTHILTHMRISTPRIYPRVKNDKPSHSNDSSVVSAHCCIK